jgi:hypothetical protein
VGVTVQVNMNDQCEVVLQERGVRAIRAHYEWLRMEPPHVEVGGVFRTQLWNLMLIMGRSCYMGPPPPFETWFTVHESVARKRKIVTTEEECSSTS